VKSIAPRLILTVPTSRPSAVTRKTTSVIPVMSIAFGIESSTLCSGIRTSSHVRSTPSSVTRVTSRSATRTPWRTSTTRNANLGPTEHDRPAFQPGTAVTNFAALCGVSGFELELESKHAAPLPVGWGPDGTTETSAVNSLTSSSQRLGRTARAARDRVRF
jgi:hypothetical protein